MDPTVAFGLVCGIIQVIDFSTKVVKKCHELYRDGASSENKEAEEMANHLTDLRAKLDFSDESVGKDLLDLGSKCSSTAQELVAELEKLRINGPHRKRQSLNKSFKAMLKKKDMEKIQKRLEGYQKLLDSRILVDLRKRLESFARQNTKNFLDLDSTVQKFITDLAQNSRSFDELKSLIQAENAIVKAQFTNELHQHQTQQAHEQYRQRFLETLFYPEIHRRQETVSEAYQKTFRWVYEPDAVGGSTHRWDSIVQWFERGNGIYWISGKAGSGKSTLMNYICQDSRSQDLLKVWSGTKEVFTPTFFFWNAGTSLEKSTEGLLRSVLYQILKRFPALTPQAHDEGSAPTLADDGHRTFGQTLAWTQRRLLQAFHNLIPQVQKKCRICIFIDGLDEIGGESDAAIEVVKSMLSADLKVCLSSRPDLAYADAFDSCPMLRLQDLTELDIRTYSRDRLHPYLQTNTQEDVSELIDGIALRAQGVFLWVDLVVKAMIKGLKNHDGVKQLRTRVDSTPSDIEALYAQMLSNIDVAYREEAAQLFHLALAGLSNSLLNVSLTLYNGVERGSGMSIQEALHLSCRTQQRIPTICAGLLEVYLEDSNSEEGGGSVSTRDSLVTLPYRYADSSESADISYYERYAHVVFIHRTAMDFLHQSKQGQHFLETYTTLGFSLHSTYVRGLLAKVTLLGFPEMPPNFDRDSYLKDDFPHGFDANDKPDDFVDKVAGAFVLEVMETVFLEENRTATVQKSLCDDVDRTLANVYKRYPVVSPLSHWSARWARVAQNRNRFWLSGKKSTRFEPTLCLSIPSDFLGVAASWGLYFYVLEMLDLQQRHLDEEYASYLMCCSVCSLLSRGDGAYGQGCSATLNVLTELLSVGGNPNMNVGHVPTTIWGLFLLGLPSVAYCCDPTALITTMKAFLKSDANVHTKVPELYAVDESQEGRSGSDSPTGLEMFFFHERSILYAIRSWLKHSPELRSVEEIIVAKGGKDSHAFTHVAFRSEGYRLQKLSRRRQKELIAALDKADHGYPSYWSKSIQITYPKHTKWKDQLGKVYREISENRPDSESGASSDEDDSSDDEADEEFFESLYALNGCA